MQVSYVVVKLQHEGGVTLTDLTANVAGAVASLIYAPEVRNVAVMAPRRQGAMAALLEGTVPAVLADLPWGQ